MKISTDAEPFQKCEDFWYCLTDGGWLDPSQYLVTRADLNKVLKAIEVLKEFENAMHEANMIEEC